MLKAVLTRLFDNGKETLGCLSLYDGIQKRFECRSLELPWKNNERQISCIPEGDYWCDPRATPERGNHFIIQGTLPRELILIHTLNTFRQTKGCIGVGMDFADIDGDSQLDITRSRITLDRIVQLAPEGFLLRIVSFVSSRVSSSQGGSA